MKKLFVIGLGVLVIVASIYGYLEYNKSHRDIVAESASVSISAVDLFDAYRTDEAEANKKYLDRVIAVSGVVSEISVEGESKMVVLQSDDDFFGVNAYFVLGQDISIIEEGDEIRVKGYCSGGDDMGVILTDCTIF
jgi:hypothetical protein